MRKKIKIFYHHNISEQAEINAVTGKWAAFLGFYKKVFRFLFESSFLIGKFLVDLVLLPKFLSEKLGKFNWKIEAKKFFRLRSVSLIFVLFAVVIPIFGLRLAWEGREFGGKVLGVTDKAKEDVDGLSAALASEDILAANKEFDELLLKFENVQNELNTSSSGLKAIVDYAPSQVNAGNILELSQSLTLAGQQGLLAWQKINELQFAADGVNTNSDLKTTLNEVEAHLNISILELKKSQELLNGFSSIIIPNQYKNVFETTKQLVNQSLNTANKIQDSLILVKALLLGKKNVLVLLQNNNELRANGGFIGTVANTKIEDGRINSLVVKSVYDYDGQLNEVINPPKPLRVANNRWFLRDANWFANFSVSAERIGVMYEKSGGETPDLIVAITPEFIISLLKISGPIKLPAYGIEITSENFIEAIQSSTSVYYDKQLNQPKQLLADLYPPLMQKISSNNQKQQMEFMLLLQKNLNQGNILLYSRDEQLQKLIDRQHWSGDLISSQNEVDYLSIVSANLSGTKTDRFIERNVHLQTSVLSNKFINKLSYKVKNPLANNLPLVNKSFVRFYVPKNAKLINASGFDNQLLPNSSAGVLDRVVTSWEDKLIYNENLKTYLGEESGKYFFAGWIELSGGEEQEVTLEYEVPYKFSSVDNYSLLVQKQPGMMPYHFSQQVNLNNLNLVWPEQGKLQWEDVLQNYLFKGWVFKK